MYRIFESKRYQKSLEGFAKKHPDLKTKYSKTLDLLKDDIHHPSLRLHKIFKKDEKELYSISLDTKYRILINLLEEDKSIILIKIGDHSEVY